MNWMCRHLLPPESSRRPDKELITLAEYVRFWHLADIPRCTAHVCFRGFSGQRIGGMWDLCLWANDFLKIWVTLDAQKIPLG